MMKLVEIRELSPGEIAEQVKKSQIELVDLRMKFVSRQLEDPSLIKKKRKEITRLLTIKTQKLNEKNVEGETKEDRKEAKKEVRVKKSKTSEGLSTDKPKSKTKESAKKAK